MRFTLNGADLELTREQVERRLTAVVPEPVREHAVLVSGRVFPVKQAFEVGAGISRKGFTSQTARRHLAGLGFEVLTGGAVASVETARRAEPEVRRSVSKEAHDWPWEGRVQAVFGNYLQLHGWTVTGMADTATKARGVDLLAYKRDRRLGAEVKGWPSVGYADPRRADEVKRTQPSTQAGHWFSQALMKAIMLRDSHPDHESLVIVPDYPRYRDLARRTVTGRTSAQVHVVFVQEGGDAVSESWSP